MKTTLVGMLFLGYLALTGCGDNGPATYDQAGSVTFTIGALSPWSQVASGMSPNFSAKADSLVATTFAATEWQESQFLQALGISAGLALPGSSTTSSSTSTNGGAPSVTVTNSLAPGSLSSLPATAVPSAALPAAAGATPTAPEGVDPLLQYEAARNLYQSIQLMNHEMQLVASGSCYEPYLIMAKLSVVPNRIDVADAVESRISFYPFPYRLDLDNNVNGSLDGCDEPGWLPRVVPILASDDLERAVRADSAEVATQISLAVSGMIHGIGGNLGANHLSETLNAVNGSEFNNRMTVYREADNTIGIRINPSFGFGGGSINARDADRQLIGQNYDLALILLVPKAYTNSWSTLSQNDKYIESIMTTRFVDPSNNKALPNKSDQQLGQETKQLLASAMSVNDQVPDLPSTASFYQLQKIYLQLGNESWARMGHALIYLSQTNHYDKLSQLLLNVSEKPDYQRYYTDCLSLHYDPSANLTYTNENLFNLPVDLQLDDAATCFILTAGWALNNNTSNFSSSSDLQSLGGSDTDIGQTDEDYLFSGFLPALWSGASQLSDESPVQIGLTPLPDSNYLQLPASSAAQPDVILVKDSNNNLNGSFAPVYVASDTPISVALTFTKPIAGAAGTLYTMAALDPSDPTNHTLTFSFPNAATLTGKDNTVAGHISFSLFVPEGIPESQRCITDPSPKAAEQAPASCPLLDAIIETAPKPPTGAATTGAAGGAKNATFALVSPPTHLTVDPTGEGYVDLYFTSFTDSKVTVSTDAGGDIDGENLSTAIAHSGTMLMMNGNTLIIQQPATPPTKTAELTVDIRLHNLKAGRPVKLTLTGSAPKQATTLEIPLSVDAAKG